MKRLSNASPAFITPMAAHSVAELPEGADWIYELKFDGYRALLIKEGKTLQIRSRNNKDLTRMYPSIAAAGLRLNANQTIVDGEIVAVNEQGRPSFQALQHRGSYPGHHIVFYAFDVLHLNGRNLMSDQRRARLPSLLNSSGVLASQELNGTAKDVLHAIQTQGLEGLVAKRRDSIYQPGERSNDWLKLKLDRQQEFVIGGYRPGSAGVDALLVGYYEAMKLLFAGKVRAGFVPHTRRDLWNKLKTIHVTRCPFANLPTTGSSRWGGGITAEGMSEMKWTKPTLVAQIRFVEWTNEGRVRHAAFLGLRFDKVAKEVHREV